MKKLTQESILKNLTSKKVVVRKSKLTAGNEYKVTLTRKDNGKKMTFSYHDNIYNDSDKSDFVESLIIERSYVIFSKSMKDFCYDLGFDDNYEEGCEVYREIRASNRKLNKFFTRTELKVLTESM